MIEVIGVSFNINKNVYYVSSNGLDIKKGDKVVANTDNGIQLGIAKTDIFKEKSENLSLPLKDIIRIATTDDIESYEKNETDSSIALRDAKKFSKDLGLDMNFIDSNYNLDRSQLIFSFVSDVRVDFRELAKKLAQKYRTRIELRQIGVRDKAKKVGGLGPCGLFLCCNSFLNDFNSVSINMAKNQYLALNPSKINGVCGRLLCCLEYENDTYSELKKGLPKVGNIAETSMGTGKVVAVDVFNKSYSVDLKEKGIIKFTQGDSDGSIK